MERDRGGREGGRDGTGVGTQRCVHSWHACGFRGPRLQLKRLMWNPKAMRSELSHSRSTGKKLLKGIWFSTLIPKRELRQFISFIYISFLSEFSSPLPDQKQQATPRLSPLNTPSSVLCHPPPCPHPRPCNLDFVSLIVLVWALWVRDAKTGLDRQEIFKKKHLWGNEEGGQGGVWPWGEREEW